MVRVINAALSQPNWLAAWIMPDSGYNTAKAAQENLIKGSGRPYSIVRATPFYEFVVGLADSASDGEVVRLPHALFRPIAADDNDFLGLEMHIRGPFLVLA